MASSRLNQLEAHCNAIGSLLETEPRAENEAPLELRDVGRQIAHRGQARDFTALRVQNVQDLERQLQIVDRT